MITFYTKPILFVIPRLVEGTRDIYNFPHVEDSGVEAEPAAQAVQEEIRAPDANAMALHNDMRAERTARKKATTTASDEHNEWIGIGRDLAENGREQTRYCTVCWRYSKDTWTVSHRAEEHLKLL